VTDDDCPKCDRCDAPITTGLMAAFCAHKEKCEFWPEDEDSQDFITELGFERAKPQEWWPLKEVA
jgi:hypothetical protein